MNYIDWCGRVEIQWNNAKWKLKNKRPVKDQRWTSGLSLFNSRPTSSTLLTMKSKKKN